MNQETFVAMMVDLTASDHVKRNEALQKYEIIKTDANSVPFLLIETFLDVKQSKDIQQLAIVLLRRLLVEQKNSIFNEMTKIKQDELASLLTQIMMQSNEPIIRFRISEICGELAASCFGDEDCQRLLEYSLACSQSADFTDREISLALISNLSGVISSQERIHLNSFLLTINNNLTDPSINEKLILLALKAFTSLILEVNRESQLTTFYPSIESIFKGLGLLLIKTKNNSINPSSYPNDTNTEPSLCSYLESLIEIADERGSFFGFHLGLFFSELIDLLDIHDLYQSVKHLVVELLVSICSSDPKHIRKFKSPHNQKGYFAIELLPRLIRYISTVEDEDDWENSETMEEFDLKSSSSDVGESAFNRVCIALGAASTYKIVSDLIGPYLTDGRWQFQYAGLQCIGNYLEVSATLNSSSQLELHRNEVIATLVLFCNRPHPRVRSAAFFAISQLFLTHGKHLKIEQLDQLLTIIVQSLPRSVNPSARLRRNVLIALIHCIDMSPTNYLEPKSGIILTQLVNTLMEGPLIVQESTISALMSITESVKDLSLWREYYPSLSPILKQLLVYCYEKRTMVALWGQTLECYAMLGEAAGKDMFYQDATQLMNDLLALLPSIQQEKAAPEEKITSENDIESFILKAWVRIIRTIGSEFLPFLPSIMSRLFYSLSLDVTVDIDEDMDLTKLEERSDIELMEKDDGSWIAIRSAAVEEQSSACHLISLLVSRLKEHFFPFVEQTMQWITKLIESPHEDIRSYSLAIIPELVYTTGLATLNQILTSQPQPIAMYEPYDGSMFQPHRTTLSEFSAYSLGLLIHSLETEHSVDLIMTGLQAIRLVINYACTNWFLYQQKLSTTTDSNALNHAFTPPAVKNAVPVLSTEQMEYISQATKQIYRDSIQRRAVLRAESKVNSAAHGETEMDEGDVEDEKRFLEESLELHYNISELIGTLLKTHGIAFYSIYFHQWHEILMELCHEVCLKEDQRFAALIICDVIEFGLDHSNAASYFVEILPKFFELIRNDKMDHELRRAACYGMGMACELYDKEFIPYFQMALYSLSQCITNGEDVKIHIQRGPCTDNAVSAVGIIVEKMEDIICTRDHQSPHVQQLINQHEMNFNFELVWNQWLSYLPLKNDTDEGVKVILQLMRLINEGKHVEWLQNMEKATLIINVLLQVWNSSLLENQSIGQLIKEFILIVLNRYGIQRNNGNESNPMYDILISALSHENNEKLSQILNLDNLQYHDTTLSSTVCIEDIN